MVEQQREKRTQRKQAYTFKRGTLILTLTPLDGVSCECIWFTRLDWII